MDAIGNSAAAAGLWVAWSVWLLLSAASVSTILVSLPGGWIALGLAVLFDLFHGFGAIGWPGLIGFAALLGVGEAVEAGLGTLYVAKKGATRYGMLGGFVGGFVGAILGSGVVPVFGTVIGGFAGAFGGAVLGEYWRDRQLEPSLRIGVHATIGKLLSVFVKFGLAVAGLAWVCVLAVP